VLAFCKVLAAINVSGVLAEYREHPGLLMKLPGYRVQMGFGLHSGWAIEGAIGSEFKVDASYLSANVKLANSIETATQTYDVNILLSGEIYSGISHEMRRLCRQIDVVRFPGSTSAMRLFTIDLEPTRVKVQPSPSRPEKSRYKLRMMREATKEARWLATYIPSDQFTSDQLLVTMRERFVPSFAQRFEMGFRNYECGEWNDACRILFEASEIIGGDGPARALISFMNSISSPIDGSAPKSWRGVRLLVL